MNRQKRFWIFSEKHWTGHKGNYQGYHPKNQSRQYQ